MMKVSSKILLVFLIFFTLQAFASTSLPRFGPGKIYQGSTLEEVSLESIIDQARPGEAFLVSELHGSQIQHEFQKTVIKRLADKRLKVNVGIEHFSHLEQAAIDAYLRDEISESDLVKTVKLTDFSNWRDQMQLPLATGGWSYGLNAPRWLSAKINAVGIKYLSSIEKQIIPPDFALGSDSYRQRVLEIMGRIHPDAGFEKLFEAQSVWDDTSAWTLIKLMNQDPQSVFVVLFGDFHISYGGGLPDRLRQRGFTKAISFSQVCLDGLSDEQVKREVMPSAEYGSRADYVVTHFCN